MKLTREPAIAEHRKMWNWIADETEKRGEDIEKTEYFLKHNIKESVACHCFCCEYAVHVQYDMPIQSSSTHPATDWGGSMQILQCQSGVFGLWVRCQDPEESAQLAHQIAELPERTDNIPVSENK